MANIGLFIRSPVLENLSVFGQLFVTVIQILFPCKTRGRVVFPSPHGAADMLGSEAWHPEHPRTHRAHITPCCFRSHNIHRFDRAHVTPCRVMAAHACMSAADMLACTSSGPVPGLFKPIILSHSYPSYYSPTPVLTELCFEGL